MLKKNLYYGSLKYITESVVGHARNELCLQGVEVNKTLYTISQNEDKSDKALKISVVSARCCDRTKFLGTNIRSEMLVSLETQSGIKQNFKIEYETPLSIPIAYNGAAIKSVVDIFPMKNFFEYISSE